VTTQPEESPRASVPLLPILSVNLIGTLGFSIVLPFLVFLVTDWGGNAFVYGLMGATYSIFQLIGAPVLGRWSDRYGRRRILLVSQIGTFVSWMIFLAAFALPVTSLLDVDSTRLGTFSLTLPLIAAFVARAADGLTGGNVSVATAYLADISTDENRNANFGKLAVSSNLGFVLGPAIAGLLGATALGEIVPVTAAAMIALTATLLIAFRLPESDPCAMRNDPDAATLRRVFGGDQKPCYEMKAAPKLSFGGALRLPGVPLLLAVYFLVMLGFNFFYIGFPAHAVRGLQWSVTNTGAFFVVLSGVMALVQGPLLGRISTRFSEASLVLVGSLILAASFLLFQSTSVVTVYLGAAGLALGNGIMWPSVVAILARTAGSTHQGAVQGFASSFGAVASIVGMLLGGLLFEVVGARVFSLSAAMIFVVFVVSFRLRRSAANVAR
jgi:MFS family permease